MIISREDLDQIQRAHGRVGKFNEAHWSKLVEKHELAAVLAAIDEIWLDTDAEVTAAQVDRALGGIGMARVRAGESDELESESPAEVRSHARKGGAAAPVVKTVSAAAEADTQPIREAAPAAATTDDSIAHPGDGFPASTTAAGDASTPTPEAKRAAAKAPWGLTEQEKNMATIKQLLKSVEDEIKRRGITAKSAQEEIGVAGTAIYGWRQGNMSPAAQEKITTWLPVSAEAPDAPSGTDETAPVVKVKVKRGDKIVREHRRTPPATEGGAAPQSRGDLIERGEQLVQRLTEFGCEEYAATVSELVEKWRTVRTALSA